MTVETTKKVCNAHFDGVLDEEDHNGVQPHPDGPDVVRAAVS